MTAPRTVWHLTDSDTMGGAERQIETLLRLTDREHWRPVLAHTGAPGIELLVEQAEACGAGTVTLPSGPTLRRGVGCALRTARLIRAAGPDLLHAHLSYPLALRWQIVGAHLARRPPLVASVHSGAIVPPNRAVLAQQRLCGAQVARYLPVAAVVRERCVETLAWPTDRMTVIHNGIESDRCLGGDAHAGRAALGAPSGPIVLMLSRLERDKGVHVFLEAAAQVPGVTFAIAGEGPERAALQTRAAALGCAGRLLLPGWVDAVPDLLAAATMVVLPSFGEALPISLLEAMATGVPVIGSDVPGILELVEDGRNGLIAATGDAAALAAAITRILNDDGLAARLTTAARERVVTEFAATVMTERVMAVYDEVLAG